jgi:hypothetical protein
VIRIRFSVVRSVSDPDTHRKGVKMMRIRILAVAALIALALAVPQAALADPGTNNCWGTVTSQRATTEQDIGEHASAQEEPRAGLGNLAQDLGISVGEVGAFLATVDELEATHCP